MSRVVFTEGCDPGSMKWVENYEVSNSNSNKAKNTRAISFYLYKLGRQGYLVPVLVESSPCKLSQTPHLLKKICRSCLQNKFQIHLYYLKPLFSS